MKHLIQIDISKGGKYYFAESSDVPMAAQARTLKELIKNLEEVVELYFAKDPDEGMKLTPAARKRLAYAKLHSKAKSNGITPEEFERKYSII